MTLPLPSADGLLISLAVLVLLHQAAVRTGRTVMTAWRPLSGELPDIAGYARSLFTPGDREVAGQWGLLAVAALGADQGVQSGSGLGWSLAVLGWIAALGLEAWGWQRVGVSVKRISWRQGWRQSVRSVPISQVEEVDVVERPLKALSHPRLAPLARRLGAGYLRLKLHEGGAARLPRTSVFTSLSDLEATANFVRLQMAIATEDRRRTRQERKRAADAARPPLDPQEEAMRRDLAALRLKAAALANPPAGVVSSTPSGERRRAR
jgi:hypothetical protein